ncbi:hypothetical protein [Streptomyces sp. NBC_01803]|uniref:hypothetical protein n=1 Tax=Streptomyces sp. NBC_01803 TaxID=2975946 RepID=UPI002DD9929A|nr:hypothetical protein [Streptomyces sp. NBC_01803]WSA43703.1 hypothetical protein OIE51_05500 [Streptomyces sp. NBC_01803]
MTDATEKVRTGDPAAAYGRLRPQEALLSRALACLPPEAVFDALDAAAVGAVPVDDAHRHLALLTEHGLLELDDADTPAPLAGTGRLFGIHRAVRGAVAELAARRDRAEQRERLCRWLDWLLWAATTIDQMVTPAHHACYPERDYDYPSDLSGIERVLTSPPAPDPRSAHPVPSRRNALPTHHRRLRATARDHHVMLHEQPGDYHAA